VALQVLERLTLSAQTGRWEAYRLSALRERLSRNAKEPGRDRQPSYCVMHPHQW